MDIYHIRFDLKPGTSDVQFVERPQAYLGHLVEQQKIAVNQLVQNARFALYRDFPDPVRQRGQERF